jgi:hypothetical protein
VVKTMITHINSIWHGVAVVQSYLMNSWNTPCIPIPVVQCGRPLDGRR